MILSIFMIIYLIIIDASFMEYLKQSTFNQTHINAFGVAAILMGEGIAGGLLISILLSLLFKSRLNRGA